MIRTSHDKWRRGRPRPERLDQPDVPYTMKLGDGRTVYVEVPGRFAVRDRGGQTAFTPDGVQFLDRVRALMMETPGTPSPGYISSLREALGLTQQELAARLGVSKMTVSRWERGTLRPGQDSLQALRQIRQEAVRQGVVLPG